MTDKKCDMCKEEKEIVQYDKTHDPLYIFDEIGDLTEIGVCRTCFDFYSPSW